MFVGKGKPVFTVYLSSFISEVQVLMNSSFDNKAKTVVRQILFVCDLPAKKYLKCVAAHNSYGGCDHCSVEGVYVSHRLTFPGTIFSVRTDNDFRNQEDESHHNGISPLTQLSIDMISSFSSTIFIVCASVLFDDFCSFFLFAQKTVCLLRQRKQCLPS